MPIGWGKGKVFQTRWKCPLVLGSQRKPSLCLMGKQAGLLWSWAEPSCAAAVSFPKALAQRFHPPNIGKNRESAHEYMRNKRFYCAR